MYNFQIVSGGIKEREIKEGLKLRPSYDEAIEENVENPMLEQYTATGVFKSQKFQNILNNDIENLDSLQRNKIRSDLLKRDLIDGGVDIHQAQEQAIQQVRQPIIAQVQDPFENIEDSLEEMYDALDRHERRQEESSSSSSAMVNREMIEQLSKDYVNDLVNRMQTQIKIKEAPKDEKVEEVEVDEPKEEKPKSKSGMMAPPKSGMFPPLYAGGSGEQPSSSSSAPAVRTRQRSRSADPRKSGGSGEMPDDETAGTKYTGPVPMEIDSLLELTYLTPTVRKELETMSNDTTRDKRQYDTLPMISLNRTKRELMSFGVTDLMLQARHPKRNIQFGGNERRNKDGEIIKPATEVIVSGINEKGKNFNITFNKKLLNKQDYVDILKAYAGD